MSQQSGQSSAVSWQGGQAGQEGQGGQKKEKKQKQKKPSPPPLDLDMKNRDPYELNKHVRTNFAEVLGEPDGAHSDDCIWINSNKFFEVGRECCYTCLTFVCAIPLAFCWGCNFACITFMHIWSITPLYRVFRINCDCAGKFFSTMVHCWCDPCYEALALMFTKIYVHVVNTQTTYQERTYRGLDELLVERNVADPRTKDKGYIHGAIQRGGGESEERERDRKEAERREQQSQFAYQNPRAHRPTAAAKDDDFDDFEFEEAEYDNV